MMHDIIVIGSGAAATEVVRVLCERGLDVAVIDPGLEPPAILYEPVEGNFAHIRRTSAQQYRWFLGEDLSSIPVQGLDGGLGGGMTSGNRAYVVRGAGERFPVRARHSAFVQSLARGGLAAAWGGTCAVLADDTLRGMGLPVEAMKSAYSEVIRAVGVSGEGHPDMDPPFALDSQGRSLLACAQDLQQESCRLSQPPSAVLTRSRPGRLAHDGADLDYYTDATRSLYRPTFALQSFIADGHCTAYANTIALRVHETESDVLVECETRTGEDAAAIRARHVILAAGALGTARILLQSEDAFGKALPILAKAHGYMACLRWCREAAFVDEPRVSTCQLLLEDATDAGEGMIAGCAQLYSYRSLLCFRLLHSLPLPVPLAMRMAAAFSPYLLLADIRWPVLSYEAGSVCLQADGVMTVDAAATVQTPKWQTSTLRLKRALRRLGAWPLSTIQLQPGTASHYAGTVPITQAGSTFFTLEETGRVRGRARTWVADSSAFRSLPALPPTLTIMAYARVVGANVSACIHT